MTQVSELITFNPNWYASASAEEQQQFRTWLLDLLNSTSITVKFRKANGELRTMVATTKGVMLDGTAISTSSSNCTVWDVEKSDWRSFKFENIIDLDYQVV
jgi:predicted DNA-binding transcriptional regulator YafY